VKKIPEVDDGLTFYFVAVDSSGERENRKN